MRLESALFTSREGITAHGQAIAVVGDNIANVNTTAYKTARPEFTDLLAGGGQQRNSEVVSGAGDGVYVGRVRVIQESGPIEATGRELDVAISGGGFFLVGAAGAPQFTRSGAFDIAPDGTLITSFGETVLGYQGTDLATLGPINMLQIDAAGTQTGQMQIYGNLNGAASITIVPQNPTSFDDIDGAVSFSSSQSVFDSQGGRHEVTIAFYKTGLNTWSARAYADGGDVGGQKGTPTQIGEATLTFNGNGQIEDANIAAAQITATANWSNGANAGNFTIDLSNFTQFASGSAINSINQDGRSIGNIEGYDFESDGSIFARLDSGDRKQIGTIPLALFSSAEGLERVASSTFAATERSGDVQVGRAGAGLRGSIEGKTLERSTVDIAKQFVDLVVYQRGYQANSQVLSAANQMMQNTIQLIR